MALAKGLALLAGTVVALLLSFLYRLPRMPPKCGDDDDDRDCERVRHRHTYIRVGLDTLRVVLGTIVVFQCLLLAGVPIIPYLTSLSLIVTVFGFALKDHIADYATGLTMILSGRLNIGDTVRVSVTNCANCPINTTEARVLVTQLTPFALRGTLVDPKHASDAAIFVRYNSILALQID